MKKILALILTLALLVSCGAVLAEEAAPEYQEGHYTVFNRTGEGIVYVGIKDSKDADVEFAYEFPEEDPLEPDDFVLFAIPIPAEEDGSHRLILSFKTVSGRTGEFTTLSIEDVSIELLAEDAMTGATPIKFGPPKQVGVYQIVNQTGMNVKSISLTDNVAGSSIEYISGIEKDGETMMEFAIDGSEDGSHRLTLSFVTEDDKEYTFGTLSIEEVTINLLAADAMTGATPIKFGPLSKPE